MGEVYRATDTKLQREVALKVLASEFAQNSAWMSRFQREARVLASLNHPHIAAIYGLEESGGVRAIAMEMVEGPTLAERMARGRIPLPDSLAIAQQIAEALEYAHEKGIVHRDLKPANVKLRPDGVVKVLDFGLAKAIDPKEATAATETATRAGVIMGTPAYMAPEQAVGLRVDRRADIWAFGVVLFEMLAGRRIYSRKTILETLAAVAKDEPPWDELPPATPANVLWLLRRCLDRDTKNRLRDIGEARINIESGLAGKTHLPESAPLPAGRPRLAWGVAVVATACLAMLAFVHFREKTPTPALPVRFQIPIPENATAGALLNVSPDGRKLAFVAGDRLWVHFLESGDSRDLTGTSGTPFWSPDSRFIGVVSDGKLKKVDVTGGPPQTVTDINGAWGAGAWNLDDLIVFSNRAGIFRVPAAGGVPVPITAVDPVRREIMHAFPSFLPDGRHFIYTCTSRDKGRSAIYLGSVDARPEQQSSQPLVNSDWGAVYSPSADPATGCLLFVREDTLVAQPFDNRRLKLKGQATPVAEQVSDGRAFSVSANGVLVFHRNAVDRQLTWFDRDGKIIGTVGNPGTYLDPFLSPDGTRLAAAKPRGSPGPQGPFSIWLLDFSRGGAGTRFTFGSATEVDPVWSPDGSRIVFSSNRDGPYNLYQKAANGGRDEEVLLKSDENKWATSWSRDGRFLLYTTWSPKTQSDIWALPMSDNKKPIPFLATEFWEGQARFSPDGHWVAYTSYESGQFEVYVRQFSINPAGTAVETGGKWQISSGFGLDPRWRGDGRELYYLSLDGRVMAVDVATNPVFRAGKPQPLGLVVIPQFDPPGAWDAAADGKRFLVPATKSGRPEPYTVVLNWQAGLKD
jgi:Tol biopolymer transport system component